jgi:3-dehydroquinate synthase
VERLRAGGARVELLTFAAGEASKNRATWGALTDRMLAAHCGRDTAVVAVGGGVTGDLAGFVAATYHRGIPVVQVPTSLVAMVDAAIGGTTGIDTTVGKNLVGAFHQPRLVVCDPAVLATLPVPALAGGAAEMLKHGAIEDAAYFEAVTAAAAGILAADVRALEPLVARSVEIKAAVVSTDERESGRRAVLNFGHTVGHAVEAASGWTVPHGAAVAAGMVVEATLGETLGITATGTAARLARSVARFDLPAWIPDGLAAEALLDGMRTDKKARARRVRFSAIGGIGRAHRGSDGAWTVAVDPERMRATLESSRRGQPVV